MSSCTNAKRLGTLVTAWQAFSCTASLVQKELILAAARGGAALRALFRRPKAPHGQALSARDEDGFGALAVAGFNGDVEAAKILLEAGAKVHLGALNVRMGKGKAPVGSVVELMVRRSAMLIMLGTPFQMPDYLQEAQKPLVTSRKPAVGDPQVPDIATTLELLMSQGGARPTEKSKEEGGDLARAAYFLDADIVEVLIRMELADTSSIGSGSNSNKQLLASLLDYIDQHSSGVVQVEPWLLPL